jgi:hypothetical protein
MSKKSTPQRDAPLPCQDRMIEAHKTICALVESYDFCDRCAPLMLAGVVAEIVDTHMDDEYVEQTIDEIARTAKRIVSRLMRLREGGSAKVGELQ